jgi:DNA-binding SARP family transcriptional activator
MVSDDTSSMDTETWLESQLSLWEARDKSRSVKVEQVAQSSTLVTISSKPFFLQALQLFCEESPSCLSCLEQGLNQQQPMPVGRVATAIALATLVGDEGSQSNVEQWVSSYCNFRETALHLPISNFWGLIGDVALFNLSPNRIGQQQVSASVHLIVALLNRQTQILGPDSRLLGGLIALEYAFGHNERALIDLLISILEHSSTINSALPVSQARWYEWLGYMHFILGENPQAKNMWQRAETLATTHNLVNAGFAARLGLVRQSFDEGDHAGARARLSLLRPAEGPGRLTNVLYYKHLIARSNLLEGRISLAKIQIDEVLAAAQIIDFSDSQRGMFIQEKAQILFADGKTDEAEALLDDAVSRFSGLASLLLEVNLNIYRSIRLFDHDLQQSQQFCIIALTKAREVSFNRFLRSLPEVAATLCARALVWGIETEFVNDTIRQRKLCAPKSASSQWPWKLRIYTLGILKILVDDIPLTFPGRTQAKPLELACFLAASRDLRSSNTTIAAALWPNEDSSKSAKSLESTTARLRRLLNDDSLVLVSGGQTWLDKTRVWSDWDYFGALSSNLSAIASQSVPISIAAAELPMTLLTTYQGAFLSKGLEAAWILGRREQGTQRFTTAAIAAQAIWADTKNSGTVEAFLEAAISLEPLSESLAFHLMKLYQLKRRPGDALRVYRFLREQMSIRLGIKPGSSVETLKQQIMTT